jgi:alpha-1,6-mannosyltransferase
VSKVQFTDIVLSSFSLIGMIWLGYFTRQSDFYQILPGLCLTFGSLYFIFQRANASNLTFYLLLGICLRLLLIPAFPNWSDDIYRFLWDGYLWNAGLNPFDHLPIYYIEQGVSIPGLTRELFNELNSPEYFTIYPPVCQAIFATATYLFPNSWYAAAIWMKLVMFGFEIGSISLMFALLKSNFFTGQLTQKNVLLYALNPLVIMEISGNLHFEGAMVFFLLLAFYFLQEGKTSMAGIAWGFSIAAKLLPLLFLPLLMRRLGWRKSGVFFFVVGLSSILLFIPLFNVAFLQNFGNSLDLYFRKFEFNASLYYLIRWLGYQFAGYNIIQQAGPILGLLVFTGTWLIVLFEKEPTWKNFPNSLLKVILLYLFLAMTIHPWYAILPLIFAVFTNFRFPVIWSGLILLTYINYSYDDYWENLWIVAFEYAVVLGWMFYELTIKPKSFSTYT